METWHGIVTLVHMQGTDLIGDHSVDISVPLCLGTGSNRITPCANPPGWAEIPNRERSWPLAK